MPYVTTGLTGLAGYTLPLSSAQAEEIVARYGKSMFTKMFFIPKYPGWGLTVSNFNTRIRALVGTTAVIPPPVPALPPPMMETVKAGTPLNLQPGWVPSGMREAVAAGRASCTREAGLIKCAGTLSTERSTALKALAQKVTTGVITATKPLAKTLIRDIALVESGGTPLISTVKTRLGTVQPGQAIIDTGTGPQIVAVETAREVQAIQAAQTAAPIEAGFALGGNAMLLLGIGVAAFFLFKDMKAHPGKSYPRKKRGRRRVR